ncbi:MAG: NUDIX hydrolase [Propionibacteriaceae bacterium]|jgi:ADP-ribose pyrophosphatase|nr:NUDIX hydrolase [Propionibacteriaceae bacterium]
MDFVVDRVNTPTGATMTRNYLEHPDSVGIIAVDEHDRIAVERQYRHPVRRRLVEAPAGLCDQPGESSYAAAQRELAEELGLAADHWSILVDVFATPGCSSQATRIFLAEGLHPVDRPVGFTLADEEADMSVAWMDLEVALQGIFSGCLMNPTLVTGVLALAAHRLGAAVSDLRPADQGAEVPGSGADGLSH